MIKRSGVEVMNQRTKNVSECHDILDVLKSKQYTSPSGSIVDISEALDKSVNDSFLYRYNLLEKDYDIKSNSKIEVTLETTTQAAVRLLSSEGKKNVVALNFASARNPGGGFIGGAIAQEEDLCRHSGLYACLKNKPTYYNENILHPNTFYTDNIIYSPNVPFIKDEGLQWLEIPYLLSIISAPAPNVSSMENIDEDYLYQVLYERMLKILKIAEAHNHETIILGAFGCGAFGNDPVMVASCFKEALNELPVFNHICFAIYDKREGTPVFNTFNSIFNNGK